MACCATSVNADVSDSGSPRLVVLVVVDQLRADYLTRFEPYFGNDGFRRLMREGAHFANAHFDALSSATAPGHATIATGATPRVHGIVANRWFMNTGTTQAQYAVTDDACEAVPPSDRPGQGRSPRRLCAPTLGDQMKLNDRRTHVVSIALKDRAAIFLGGRLADTALWWNFGNGHFDSSTFYSESLPAYVQEFNAADPSKRFDGYVWRPLTPASALAGAYPLESAWHPLIELMGTTFPHALPPRTDATLGAFHEALWATPAGSDLVLDLVEKAIAAESLGQDDIVDLLCIGFSSNDAVGHFFGPQSAEVMDMTVQTDRQIARLLAMLDKQVGPDRYILALTADHGVKATPQVLEGLGMPGGLYDARQLGNELNAHLKKAFFDTEGDSDKEHLIVVGVEVPYVYFNMPLIESLPIERRHALFTTAVQFLKSKDFIADAYGPEMLSGVAPPATDVPRLLAWNAWHPANAGQICFRVADNWKKRDGNLAGHNGGSHQERHVPILLRGPRVAPGRYYAPASPCDIAVTLAALLGIEPPSGAQGKVLHEAMPIR
ncbi:MAG: alkaline phosphatase family protein [Phycisphaerales bacterium]|nr:alkaline phosphatase family protein [Phycisphaerales bacterium]MCB9864192.1 alkaline phosphatase family protein [Phycisphaerales bacterium]